MSKMIERAKRELELSGVDEDIYGDMTSKAVLELLDVFDKQGHSGMSASLVSHLFMKLVKGEALTPLTDHPDEWVEVADNLWQNYRNSAAFSEDHGQTYSIRDEDVRDPENGTRTVIYHDSKQVDGGYADLQHKKWAEMDMSKFMGSASEDLGE